MQKKIIALAIAGLSGAAFAQTNVTLYGQVDQYLGNFNVSGNSGLRSAGLQDGGLGPSRLGLKGSEDLGNGLKAVFNIENALKTDDNSNGSAFGAGARQQLLGLAGGFGTVAAGFLQTAAYDWSVKYSTLGGTALDTLRYSADIAGAAAKSNDRVSNAVAYISPNISGLTLKANYAFVSETGNTNNNNLDNNGRRGAYLLAADYDNGPLSAGLVYRQVGKDGGNAAGTGARYETGVAASYNFGPASLQAAWQNVGTSNQSKRGQAYSIGVKAPVSAAGTVLVAFGRGFAATTNANTNAGNVNTTSIAYLHGLSKRTTVYTGYVNQTGKNTAANTNIGLASPADTSGSVNGIVAGIQHKF
jgi:predicted porin